MSSSEVSNHQATTAGTTHALLTFAGPLLFFLNSLLQREFEGIAPVDSELLVAAALAASLGGIVWIRARRLTLVILPLAFIAWGALSFPLLKESPAISLAALILFTGLVGLASLSHSLRSTSMRFRFLMLPEVRRASLRAAAWSAIGLFGLVKLLGLSEFRTGQATEGATALLFLLWAWMWAITERRRKWLRVAWIACITVLTPISVLLALRLVPAHSVLLLALPVTALLLAHGRASGVGSATLEIATEHPARLLVLTFLTLSAVGSLLLYLPEASSTGTTISFVDAVFTAVSGVCVTGLIVLDTPVDFSRFGQSVILVLIQLGGLGIMTFYTAAISLLGRRLSVRHERTLTAVIGTESAGTVLRSIRRIFLLTGVSELIGAVALFILFVNQGESAGEALWRAVFTAISAFCNAGFALQSNSLIPYQGNVGVLAVVGTLIVLGGLSPVVVAAIPNFLRGRRVALQAQLALYAAIGLLLVGFIGFAAFEWNYALKEMAVWDRFTNALFQSVTTRTAGFNSIEFSDLQPATLFMTMTLMWIGGSPGGTAGGIKTTTFALLLLAVIASFRGQSRVTAFGRTITHEGIYRSAAVLSASVAVGLFVLFGLLLTQSVPVTDLLFETISALGTVGLSTGATGQLDTIGKVIVVFGMFAGRVGPLTLFLFLSAQRAPGGKWIFPTEEVAVG